MQRFLALKDYLKSRTQTYRATKSAIQHTYIELMHLIQYEQKELHMFQGYKEYKKTDKTEIWA